MGFAARAGLPAAIAHNVLAWAYGTETGLQVAALTILGYGLGIVIYKTVAGT